MSRQTGELVGFWEAERCWYEVETRWTAITTGRGTTGPQPPRCAGSRGRLRSPHRVAPRLQGSEGFGRGFQPCQPEYPNRGFVSSIGRDCKARTAGEACPVHAARPHVSHPPRSANQHSTPARCPGPARPAHTGRTRCTSDARRTLRRNNRPRHAPAPATHARPQQPPRRQLPALPPPAAPAAASPRRMMALRHHFEAFGLRLVCNCSRQNGSWASF